MKKYLITVMTIISIVLYSATVPKEKESIALEEVDLGAIVPSAVSLPFPDFEFPIQDTYRISSGFGIREQVIAGMGGEEGDFHRGIDIVAIDGARVNASYGGIVHLHYPAPNRYYKGHPVFGGLVVLNHGNGVFTVYGHLSKTFIKTGQFVAKGEKIGLIGNTGYSTGTHLHFEIIFNPFKFFDIDKYF